MSCDKTDIHEQLSSLESSNEFKEFSLHNPDHYLVHVFCQVKGGRVVLEWGYYSEESDMIVVFETDPIKMRPPEKVFKEGGVLVPLSCEKVAVGFEQVREIAEACRRERYQDHPVQQELCILQQDPPVWNITLVFHTLNMLNLRIDAQEGKILHEDMRNILDLRAESAEK